MVQKYVVQLIDDLTQEPIEEGAGDSVFFAVDGVSYAIDLTSTHADELRSALAPYVSAGRKAESAARAKPSASPARTTTGDTKAIREWASQHGYTVSTRGRIPAEVQAAYNNR